jgi:hypothetical protein
VPHAVRPLSPASLVQGMDIHWRDTGQCPTLEQYEDMVCKKTGGLFRLSVGLMQAPSLGPPRPPRSPLPRLSVRIRRISLPS